MSQNIFQEAIHALTELGTVIGLQHPADNACGRRPRLNPDQLADALITAPFEVAPSSPTTPAAPAAFTTGATTSNPATTTTAAGPARPAVQPISTTFLPTRLEIRQQVASDLNNHPDRRILSVRFALTYNERTAEMSTLPSLLRGSLSGPGKFAGEASSSLPARSARPKSKKWSSACPISPPAPVVSRSASKWTSGLMD